ncbi:MAG: FHA domain-containing protein [Candidatus Riflebacteria bacterium]|nr:FHA domain-containing protein [Candidatus Riflebacteria bacterium]
MPDTSDPRSMFVAEVAFKSDEKTKVTIEFDATQIQFLGAVIPSPDVQADGNKIEVSNSDGQQKTTGLKFLHFGDKTQTSLLLFSDNKRIASKIVNFHITESKGSYNIHLLIAAIVFFIIGMLFWKTQKKNVNLMSTRSLYMNYEEIQKLGKLTKKANDNDESKTNSEPQKPVKQEKIEEPPIFQKKDENESEEKSSTIRTGMSAINKNFSHPATDKKPAEADITAVKKHPPADDSTMKSPFQAINDKRLSDHNKENEDIQTKSESKSESKSIPDSELKPELKSETISEKHGNQDEVLKIPLDNSKTIKKDISTDITRNIPESSPEINPTDITKDMAINQQETNSQKNIQKENTNDFKTKKISGIVSTPSGISNIHIIIADSQGKKYECSSREITIGRAKNSGIIMTASEISRNHACVRLLDGNPVLIPISESNITEINGTKINTPSPVKVNDILSFGGKEFTVVLLTIEK